MKAFIFYDSFMETINMVPDESDRTTLLLALIETGLTGVEPEIPYPLNMPLHQMAASIKGASSRRQTAIENGKKGGAPKGNQNARRKTTNNQNNQNNLNKNENINKNINVNENSCLYVNEEEKSNSPSAPAPAYGGAEHQDFYISGGFKYRMKDGENIGPADN